MIKNIFNNYEAFYNMVLSTTIMSNVQSTKFKEDSSKIIDFIGKSYKLDKELVCECEELINNKLSSLALVLDQEAVSSCRNVNNEFTDIDILLDIKCDVITKLQGLSEKNNNDINSIWFDYNRYIPYKDSVRFNKINITSATGNLITTRQIGLLRALGIGCEVDLKESIKRLTQCIYWGDIPSIHYLAYVYKLLGDTKNSKIFTELGELSEKYLLAGYTVLPDEVKSHYSQESRTYYIYISTIKQDIVYAYNRNNIDFSFIEAITLENLDYFQIMNFINNYEHKTWKNLTNSSEAPAKKLGFN